MADYLGWKAISREETAQGVAGCFCSCCLHWTNHFWPHGGGVNHNKVLIGLVSGKAYMQTSPRSGRPGPRKQGWRLESLSGSMTLLTSTKSILNAAVESWASGMTTQNWWYQSRGNDGMIALKPHMTQPCSVENSFLRVKYGLSWWSVQEWRSQPPGVSGSALAMVGFLDVSLVISKAETGCRFNSWIATKDIPSSTLASFLSWRGNRDKASALATSTDDLNSIS